MVSDQQQLRMRIGAALARRREELRLTQEEVAERCGISSRHWRDLESAKRAGRLEVMEKILRGLSWSWHDLADGLSAPSTASRDRAIHRLLASAWERADPRGRQVLTAILQTLATSYQNLPDAAAAPAAEAREPCSPLRRARSKPPK